jgi:hypothetical protein
MKAILTGFAGTILQALWLSAFMRISQSTTGAAGKAIVIAAAAASIIALLCFALQKIKEPIQIGFLPVLLTSAYLGAFFLVGVFVFPDLLSGASFSAGYIQSILRVGAAVFLIYALATVTLYGITKITRRAGVHNSTHSHKR